MVFKIIFGSSSLPTCECTYSLGVEHLFDKQKVVGSNPTEYKASLA
jgi:urease accessory protein UreF